MIHVYVTRKAAGNIESITIDGHAGFADPGEDIVCAAISGISLGMINAVYNLLGIELPVVQGDGGYLECRIPPFEQGEQEKVQLLMDAMISSLQSVAIEYGKYVKVHDRKVNRRWTSC
ncbi:ribosomal-processing cysteine protease Prp [Ammoniphilus resinae]|nr:ribosomal-processing cysteine protease Prp [Ammoniphilus resinae]